MGRDGVRNGRAIDRERNKQPTPSTTLLLRRVELSDGRLVGLGDLRSVQLLRGSRHSVLGLASTERKKGQTGQLERLRASKGVDQDGWETDGPLLSIEDEVAEDLGSLESSPLSDGVDLCEHGGDDLGVLGELVEAVVVDVDAGDRLALEEVAQVGLVQGRDTERLVHLRVGVQAQVVEHCERRTKGKVAFEIKEDDEWAD